MIARMKQHLRTGHESGITWNLASFIVVGLSGLLINILIARYYAPDVLGLFNFVLAVFIFGGQFGAFAIQHSVLYHTPRAVVRGKPSGEVLLTGLFFSAGISLVVASIVYFCGPWLEQAFSAPNAALGIKLSVPGLFLFPLNKIFLAYLNGKREMALYAVGNGLRSILIVGSLWGFALGGVEGTIIPVSLSISELVLFLILSFSQRDIFKSFDLSRLKIWQKRHLTFGSRGVLGGILFELNTRIDVFVLAFLADMHAVGIYSMASIFAEGLFQLLIVLRYSYDPLIAKYVVEGRRDDLYKLVQTGRKIGYLAMAGIGVLSIALYPWVLRVLVGHENFADSWHVYAVLAFGIMFAAGYIPFTGLLQQSGKPGKQSLLIGSVMATNLLGNIALVPFFGVMGAASATAFSQCAYVFYLKRLARKNLSLSI